MLYMDLLYMQVAAEHFEIANCRWRYVYWTMKQTSWSPIWQRMIMNASYEIDVYSEGNCMSCYNETAELMANILLWRISTPGIVRFVEVLMHRSVYLHIHQESPTWFRFDMDLYPCHLGGDNVCSASTFIQGQRIILELYARISLSRYDDESFFQQSEFSCLM